MERKNKKIDFDILVPWKILEFRCILGISGTEVYLLSKISMIQQLYRKKPYTNPQWIVSERKNKKIDFDILVPWKKMEFLYISCISGTAKSQKPKFWACGHVGGRSMNYNFISQFTKKNHYNPSFFICRYIESLWSIWHMPDNWGGSDNFMYWFCHIWKIILFSSSHKAT